MVLKKQQEDEMLQDLRDAEILREMNRFSKYLDSLSDHMSESEITADTASTLASCPSCFAQMGEPQNDFVNSPSHYVSGGIECIDCIKAALGENFIGFLLGNVIKYVYRYRNKNGLEDLKKAKWYLERAIKEMEKLDEES